MYEVTQLIVTAYEYKKFVIRERTCVHTIFFTTENIIGHNSDKTGGDFLKSRRDSEPHITTHLKVEYNHMLSLIHKKLKTA